jgi:WD40 repeat protein
MIFSLPVCKPGPWWKRRALRVFRDESSLSANPHLWSSITEALDGSSWFVLLLSEDAARSEWVNREVEYWVEHKDPSRILPVVTDGEFLWADGDISRSSTAAPPALSGVFTEEPRWGDLRWARTDTDLDLSNPRFSDAVADIASAIRGVPKDELASEEVRQHRRTIRTAWAAGVVVLLLGVAATVGAIVAVGQSNEAQDQRDEAQRQSDIAQAERDVAQEERDRADQQARIAEENAALAVREAAVARSGELAAASASTLNSDAELAALLAALSITTLPEGVAPSVESIRALRVADQEHRLRLRVSTGSGQSVQRVEVIPDSKTAIYLNAIGRVVAAVDLETGSEMWSRSFAEEDIFPMELAISPNGATVAVLIWDTEAGFHQLRVLSAATGTTINTLPPSCPSQDFEWWPTNPFSPDGSVFVFHTGTAGCADDPDAGWASFVDTETWSEINRLQVAGGIEVAGFARAADRLVVSYPLNERVEIRSYPDLEIIQTFHGSSAVISPEGDRVVLYNSADNRFAIHDVETGALLGYPEGQDRFPWDAVFSPDGETLAVTTEGHDILVDGHDGSLLLEFGSLEITGDGAFLWDGSAFVTVAAGLSVLKVWELGRGGASGGVQIGSAEVPVVHVNPDRIIDGPRAAVHALANGSPFDGINAALHLIDESTGETLDSIEAASAAQLPDGRFVIATSKPAPQPGDGQPDTLGGGLALWDPERGDITPLTDCSVLLSAVLDEVGEPVSCPDGEPPFSLHMFSAPWILVSPDGLKIAASSSVLGAEADSEPKRLIRIWDIDSLTVLRTIEVEAVFDLVALGDDWLVLTREGSWAPMIVGLDDGEVLAEFDGLVSPGGPEIANAAPAKVLAGGRYLVARTNLDVLILDTTNWTQVARWQAHDGRMRGLAPSSDESRLATSAADETVRIWDLSDILDGAVLDRGQIPPLLDEIPTGVVSDVRWISPHLIGLVTIGGTWTTVSLDPAQLVHDLASRLTRSFTDRECQTFRIDPCPTLDEIRSG